MSTKIEWTEETWNPVTGCTKISDGCKNCYAERMSKRLAGRYGYPPAPHNFDVTLHPDRLDEPLRWRKSRRVFVCSMGDLFHKDVPDWFINEVFNIMTLAPQHTFQVLTKRPTRMRQFVQDTRWLNRGLLEGETKNVWLGVTAENQEQADERIEVLRYTPAAVRFVSFEPLLGEVVVGRHIKGSIYDRWSGIHQAIVGGESGPGARSMHPDWARSLRDQCQAANVPFFFKQWGEWKAISGKRPQEVIEFQQASGGVACQVSGSPLVLWRVGKRRAGRLLDGYKYEEFPQ